MKTVLWTGGGYEGREGIEVEVRPNGLEISAWYDGGVGLEGTAVLTWEQIDTLRSQSIAESSA